MPCFKEGRQVRLSAMNQSVATLNENSFAEIHEIHATLEDRNLSNLPKILCIDRPGAWNDNPIVLTFGPGKVRYVRGTDLLLSSYKKIVDEIDLVGFPQIEIPNQMELFINTDPFFSSALKFTPFHFDCLFAPIDVKIKIHLITLVADEYRRSPFPCEAYWAFSSYLGLATLNLEEFRFCFIETSSREIVNSYIGSDDHEVVEGYVFSKSHFWNEARRSVEKGGQIQKLLIEEAAQVQEQLKAVHRQKIDDEASQLKLTESNYTVFVYVMEDTRNGLVKIGKSKHPKKRERTLQSEAPSTELRLAVPCDESTEAELHERYSTARVRGEWFKIDRKTLFELVTELLRRGDAARTVTEKQWLGELMIQCHCSDDPQ